MQYPENIVELAEKNTALIESLGFNPLSDDPFELDSADIFLRSGLFTEEATAHIFANQHAEGVAADALEFGVPRKIGMLLIRPDMIQAQNAVTSFISERFTLLDSSEVIVTPEAYWGMYKESICTTETVMSRFTRAAVYINTMCRLLIFEKANFHKLEAPVADTVFANLKGRQGQYRPDTIRGDIVYKKALEYGYHTLDDAHIARAVDPFGAYRKIVTTTSDHDTLAHPLLFFTGVGVHIPDYQEMQRDLPLLLSEVEDYEDAA